MRGEAGVEAGARLLLRIDATDDASKIWTSLPPPLNMSKRSHTLDGFFLPPAAKRARVEGCSEKTNLDEREAVQLNVVRLSEHAAYPFAIPHLPAGLCELLNFVPATDGRVIKDQPDLDLIYFQPYIPKNIERDLFEFLRRELFFYRVKYTVKRGPVETLINTPRFTTVFGLDDTALFDGQGAIVDVKSGKPVARNAYSCRPRPLPQCLDMLRVLTEGVTGCRFNFALVNYYASGSDSISWHSDDERFLGLEPAIASFSLGASRDFLLKHKPIDASHLSEKVAMKLPLASGDMVLMKGLTQSRWLHSIPKRKGGDADKGRINITFRRAMVRGGTDNYYRYNVGDGEVYKWNNTAREMSVLTRAAKP